MRSGALDAPAGGKNERSKTVSANLVSIVYTFAALAAAFFAAPKTGDYRLMRIIAYWAIATAAIFLLPYKLLVLFLLGCALAILGHGAPAYRVALYIGTLAAVPDYYSEQIPFPGINYLIELDPAKTATIFLFGPLFFEKLFAPVSKKLRVVDAMLLAFVLLTGVLSIRDLPFTSMLRSTLNQFLLIYIPYIAISRSLTTQEEIEKVLKALFVSCLICAGVGLVSLAVHWNYYLQFSPDVNYKAFIETRNGLLRIYSTTSTTMLALLMGAGVVCAFYLRSQKIIAGYVFMGAAFVLGFTAFATGSRGGWLAAALVAGSYVIFERMGAGVRRVYLLILGGAVAALFAAVFQDSALLEDEYGTFNYRAELLRVSVAQIAQRPLFGSSDFLSLPSFEALRQGEGIIDLVNAYLQITLFYGLTGLALFLGANLATLNSGLRLLKDLPPQKRANAEEARKRRLLSVLLAMLLGYMGLLATTSSVSYVWHFGYIFLALNVAQIRMMTAAETAPAPSPAPSSDAPPPEETPASPARVPYGARFVRRF